MAAGPLNNPPQSKNSPQQSSEKSSSNQKCKSTNPGKGTKPQLKISRDASYVKQAEAKSAYTFVKDAVTGAIVALKGKPKSDDDSNEVLTPLHVLKDDEK